MKKKLLEEKQQQEALVPSPSINLVDTLNITTTSSSTSTTSSSSTTTSASLREDSDIFGLKAYFATIENGEKEGDASGIESNGKEGTADAIEGDLHALNNAAVSVYRTEREKEQKEYLVW